MISILTADLDYAAKIHSEMHPEASSMASKGFRTKAKAHLSRDYSEARGLKVFGLEGCTCRPAVELIDYEDELGTEVSWAVIVDDGKGGLRFDSSELLLYNAFTRDMEGRKERQEQIKQQYIQNGEPEDETT